MNDLVVNIHDAKTRLSQLVARAERGERITIARAGKAVALLGPTPRSKRAAVPPDDPLLNLEAFAVEGVGGPLTYARSIASSMADREVFVDTSGLHALVDKRDACHTAAREAVAVLVRRGSKPVVTDDIVDETVTLARARRSDRVALRILDLIEQSVGIRVERIDVARVDATKAYFRTHADHAYSFTDCSSLSSCGNCGSGRL